MKTFLVFFQADSVVNNIPIDVVHKALKWWQQLWCALSHRIECVNIVRVFTQKCLRMKRPKEENYFECVGHLYRSICITAVPPFKIIAYSCYFAVSISIWRLMVVSPEKEILDKWTTRKKWKKEPKKGEKIEFFILWSSVDLVADLSAYFSLLLHSFHFKLNFRSGFSLCLRV